MDLGKARDAQLSEREPAVAPFHKHGMKFGNVTGIFSRFAHGPNFFWICRVWILWKLIWFLFCAAG